MSYKAAAFLINCPQPQTLDKFTVYIPGILTSPLMVTEAVLPHDVYNESAIWVGGQPVYLPTKSQVPGEWECVMEENCLQTSRVQILLKWRLDVSDVSGTTVALRDITIIQLDTYTGSMPVHIVILKKAWLKSVDPIQFGSSKNTETVKYRLKFRYQSIFTLY